MNTHLKGALACNRDISPTFWGAWDDFGHIQNNYKLLQYNLLREQAIEVTANSIVEHTAARGTTEHGIIVDIEDALFKRVRDHDLRISMNSANQQAVFIVFELKFLLLVKTAADF